ncbi:MAG: outer membrane beta-barrel protein [Pseudomonadota bacterium]
MGTLSKMTTLVAALATTTAMGFSASTASAADLLIDPPVIEAPVVVQKGGWYLRGDVTYDFQEIRGAYAYGGSGTFEGKDFEVDDAFDIGFGVGYDTGTGLRVDATLDYVFEADLKGSFACFDRPATATLIGTTGCGADNMTAEKATFTTFKAMANAYYDLGRFGNLTPYVGAGLGGAYVKYDGYMQDAVNTFVDGTTTSQMHKDLDGSWRFAWALHAGASYDISERLKFDVGYSYNRIEEGPIAGFDLTNSSDRAQIYDEGFNTHVIKAGLRYHLW